MQPRERMRCGSAARAPWNTPDTLVPSTRCQSSRLASVALPCTAMPALLTITSSRPKRLTVASISACTASHCDTSAGWASVRSSGRSARVAASLSSLRSAMATIAPSCEKRRAVAAPMPEPAPVTMTTLPAKRCAASSAADGKSVGWVDEVDAELMVAVPVEKRWDGCRPGRRLGGRGRSILCGPCPAMRPTAPHRAVSHRAMAACARAALLGAARLRPTLAHTLKAFDQRTTTRDHRSQRLRAGLWADVSGC